jgi:hypothetical protein
MGGGRFEGANPVLRILLRIGEGLEVRADETALKLIANRTICGFKAAVY